MIATVEIEGRIPGSSRILPEKRRIYYVEPPVPWPVAKTLPIEYLWNPLRPRAGDPYLWLIWMVPPRPKVDQMACGALLCASGGGWLALAPRPDPAWTHRRASAPALAMGTGLVLGLDPDHDARP